MPFVGDMPENAGSNNNEQNSASVNSNIDRQVLEYLKQLNDTLNYIAKNSKRMSQSDAQFEMPRRDDFRSRAKDHTSTNKKKPFRSTGNAADDFMDSFEDVILESFLGSSFKRDLSTVFGNMAKAIGEEVRDIPGALTKTELQLQSKTLSLEVFEIMIKQLEMLALIHTKTNSGMLLNHRLLYKKKMKITNIQITINLTLRLNQHLT